MTRRILTAVLHKEEDLYVAECPEVGTVSQGYSVEEAVANLKEATELYLEDFLIFRESVIANKPYHQNLLPATCYLLPATCYLLPATCYLRLET